MLFIKFIEINSIFRYNRNSYKYVYSFISGMARCTPDIVFVCDVCACVISRALPFSIHAKCVHVAHHAIPKNNTEVASYVVI